jgi:hypothetical protein
VLFHHVDSRTFKYKNSGTAHGFHTGQCPVDMHMLYIGYHLINRPGNTIASIFIDIRAR